VPALRKLALDLTFAEALVYNPRFRPAFPIAVGVVALALLYGIARTLRRPHVRAALANGPATSAHLTGQHGASMT
jgi:hypothetical protein